MKIEKKLLQDLLQALRKASGKPSVEELDGEHILTFEAADVSAVFLRRQRAVFQVLSFQLFGREFVITPDMRLTVLNDEGAPLEVEDEAFGASVHQYLAWRVAVLDQFGL